MTTFRTPASQQYALAAASVGTRKLIAHLTGHGEEVARFGGTPEEARAAKVARQVDAERKAHGLPARPRALSVPAPAAAKFGAGAVPPADTARFRAGVAADAERIAHGLPPKTAAFSGRAYNHPTHDDQTLSGVSDMQFADPKKRIGPVLTIADVSALAAAFDAMPAGEERTALMRGAARAAHWAGLTPPAEWSGGAAEDRRVKAEVAGEKELLRSDVGFEILKKRWADRGQIAEKKN